MGVREILPYTSAEPEMSLIEVASPQYCSSLDDRARHHNYYTLNNSSYVCEATDATYKAFAPRVIPVHHFYSGRGRCFDVAQMMVRRTNNQLKKAKEVFGKLSKNVGQFNIFFTSKRLTVPEERRALTKYNYSPHYAPLYNENEKGILKPDLEKSKQALAYINAVLDRGLPVMVAISHTNAGASSTNQGVTPNHWIVINGRDIDENGSPYFLVQDSGNRKPNTRLYVYEDKNGEIKIYKPGTEDGCVPSKYWELSAVRMYDELPGLNLEDIAVIEKVETSSGTKKRVIEKLDLNALQKQI